LNNNKYKRLILLLLLIAVVSTAVALWALFFRNDIEIIAPDRVPAVDNNAEDIPGDNSEKSDAPAGGGSVNLTFSKDVTINLSDKSVGLYFASPNKSTHDIVLQIVVEDTVIAQSGTIAPGNQVKELELMENADKILSKGGYDGKFLVHFYDKSNGNKDDVNTEIPINIEVK